MASFITLPITTIPTGGTVSISLDDLAAALITQAGSQIRLTDGHLVLGTLSGSIDLGPLPGWGAPHVTILTTGSSWTVPTNWNNSNNKIELVGSGAPALVGNNGTGGGYAMTTNYQLTPGSTVDYQIGVSDIAGGDTWFDAPTILMASGGKHAGGGFVPGTGSGSALTIGYSGGGAHGFPTPNGGGAAGPNGTGGFVVDSIYNCQLADGGTVPADSSGIEWGTVGCGSGGTYPGENGHAYGGGGAGTDGTTSIGVGADGLIVITYYTLTP